MGRKRATIIVDRLLEDEYGLDGITTKLKTVSVYQGFIDGQHEFAIVQKSGRATRQPKEIEIWSHTIRNIKTFDPIIFDAPADSKWCSNCGDWVSKRGFSPKKDARDGLHPICKTCRNEMEQRRYWAAKRVA